MLAIGYISIRRTASSIHSNRTKDINVKINQFQPYARSERSVGDCTTETEVLSQDLRIEKEKTKKLEQQLKLEQQNLKNCLEKQPSTRSILEPLLELLCKADRDKVNELQKQLEDQKKIVEISGREHAQLALNILVCQKQLMNLSDSLQSAVLKSDEMKKNCEASLREIQNKVSNCEVDLIKTGETVEFTLQNEIREGGEVKLPPPRAPLSHVFVCMPPGVENSREIAENSSTLCELFDR